MTEEAIEPMGFFKRISVFVMGMLGFAKPEDILWAAISKMLSSDVTSRLIKEISTAAANPELSGSEKKSQVELAIAQARDDVAYKIKQLGSFTLSRAINMLVDYLKFKGAISSNPTELSLLK